MKRPTKKQSFIIGGAFLALVAIGFGIWQYREGPSVYASVIPSEIRRDVDFTLYVPRQMPSGYRLKEDGGVKFVDGVVFMQFTKDDQTIFISQQKKPTPEPSLSTLKGFKPLDISIGQAVAGEQDGSAAAIILSKDSLITIAGDGTVSTADLSLVAKRLELLN